MRLLALDREPATVSVEQPWSCRAQFVPSRERVNSWARKRIAAAPGMKYVLVSGGVVSGLGKGVTASSIGVILKNCGHRVTSVKIGAQ